MSSSVRSSNDSCPTIDEVWKKLPEDTYYRNFYFHNWNKEPLLTNRKILAGFTMLIIIVGTLGNISTFPTLYRFRSLRSSTRIFFFSIAICDVFGMPIHMMYIWYSLQYAENFANYNIFWCSAYVFAAQLLMGISWISLAAVAVERFLLVSAPQKMRMANPKSYAIVVECGCVVLSLMAAMANAGFTISKDCICIFTMSLGLMNVTRVFQIFFYLIVVFQLFFSGTSLWRILAKRNAKVQPGKTATAAASSGTSLQPVMMALTVGLFQSLSMVPYLLHLVKEFILGGRTFLFSAGVDLLYFHGSIVSMTCNFAFNFFIYLIVCRGFRDSFFSYFPCLKKRKTDESVSNTSTTRA